MSDLTSIESVITEFGGQVPDSVRPNLKRYLDNARAREVDDAIVHLAAAALATFTDGAMTTLDPTQVGPRLRTFLRGSGRLDAGPTLDMTLQVVTPEITTLLRAYTL